MTLLGKTVYKDMLQDNVPLQLRGNDIFIYLLIKIYEYILMSNILYWKTIDWWTKQETAANQYCLYE